MFPRLQPRGLVRRVTLCFASLAVVLALVSGDTFAMQAAAETREVVIHVSQRHPVANDDGPGTETVPYRTIQAAARRALQLRAEGLSVRVAIHGGVYRETVSISEPILRTDAPPLVFEGIDPDVVVAGSDVFASLGSDPDAVQSAVWPYRWGVAPIPEGWDPVTEDLLAYPVVRRSEMVFVGGTLLAQVMSGEEVGASAGRFWVDESVSDATPGTLWWRPNASPEAGADGSVEVAIRPVLFYANRVGSLVVRGITFRHAATPLQDAAVRLTSCANVLLEDLRIEWNSWNGLAVQEGRNITLRRVAANHNGAGGLNVWRMRDLVVEDVEASYNNWRGAWGGFTGWATGQKFFSLHGARFSRYQAVGNQATGLWFDSDHADVLVEESRLCDNATRGLFIQGTQGPLTVRDSVICGNGQIGVFATAAAGITLERNVIWGNGEHQIFVPWQAGHHEVARERNYETGETMAIRSQGWTLSQNIVEGDGQSLLFSVGQWPEFLSTLTSDHNQWFHATRRDAFGLYADLHAPASRVDLEDWRALSRQDRSSTFRIFLEP